MNDELINIRRFLFVLSIIVSSIIALPAHAVSLIRDAEIEHYLRTISTPIFREAGLNPDNVRIFIVQDNSINAFVAGGANIFIHTGLLRDMDNPNMLIGVIAHETGHISGGHLARGSEQLRGAQLSTILGYVLGAAAAVGGSSEAGISIISTSQHIAQRNVLSFTRANEQSADQAAVTFLDRLGISSDGMYSTFLLLRRNEQRQFGTPDPYAQTHPLSGDRMEFVRSHMETAKIPQNTYPREYDIPHQRMRAKLFAFLELPPKTFARYSMADRSIAARIARAVAWYKVPELKKALTEVDALIAENPKDPFLYDLKGQVLFENGRVRDAMNAYARANELLPNNPLLLTAYGETLTSLGDPASLKKAVEALERANDLDSSNNHSWRLLATAQGKLGNEGRSHLALAEEAALQNNPGIVKREAEQALEKLPEKSPSRLRAEDLKRLAAEMKEKADDR